MHVFCNADFTLLREGARMNDQIHGLAPELTNSPGVTGISDRAMRAQILGDDVLLTVSEVAALVGVSVRQIYAMIHRRTFPGPRKIGALSRWTLGTVKRWLHDPPQRA
jgi:excisionase family DNA binding protein